jgi:hydrogenase nickel incorporation protein HypA/HybF
MHEASLVASLLRQVEALVAQNGGGLVKEIRVSIGPLAGVEPRLFEEAFQRLRTGSVADSSTLAVDHIPLSARCRGCSVEYQSDELTFVCPECGGRNVDVTSGDAVILESFLIIASTETEVSL